MILFTQLILLFAIFFGIAFLNENFGATVFEITNSVYLKESSDD